MSGRLGAEWDAVFRDGVDLQAVNDVVRVLAWAPRAGRGQSSVILQAPYLGHHTIRDPLQALGGDVSDKSPGIGQAHGVNFAFRRHDVDQADDSAPKVFILHVLQLVRKQDDQHVLVRGQYAGHLGIGFHSCCLPPSVDGLVALGATGVVRNRAAILQTLASDAKAVPRTPFASGMARAYDAFFRTIAGLGDLVAAFGARLTGGAA
jgi:hypothetical protein